MTAALAPWWAGGKGSYSKYDHVVYRAYDAAGRLIYIGSSRDVESRFAQHERWSWWHRLVSEVTTVAYPTKEAATAAEEVAIQEEQPAFNVRGTTEGPVLTREDAEAARRWAAETGNALRLVALVRSLNRVEAASTERHA